MPRRNRNARAAVIDTDELAAHAAQLTLELAQRNHMRLMYLANEIQLYSAGMPSAGKSSIFRDYLIAYSKSTPTARSA